ncbi:hypothetical protein MHU86_18455 [Fragilaria crotonensis]|nr:hypothetical protein MHU86_18455 [Fragilaria crotonensis]
MASIAISVNNENNNHHKRNNNYVAMSEYRAALSGIENRIHQILEGYKNREGCYANSNGDFHGHDLDDNDNSNADDDELYGTLLETTKESLKKHLDRIVQPLDNEEYNAMLRVEFEDSNVDPVALDFDNDDLDQDIDENELDIENTQEDFDPDELIDQDAVLRVTKLREEIRLASEHLALYRDSVTLKALQLADQQIRLTTTTTQESTVDTIMPMEEGGEHQQQSFSKRTVEELREEFASATEPNAEITQLLTDRLNQLTQNLNTLDLESPAQLLQETLDTVELVQQEPLSQTERAIKSRDNEGMHFSNKVVEDPLERLNLFLG